MERLVKITQANTYLTYTEWQKPKQCTV